MRVVGEAAPDEAAESGEVGRELAAQAADFTLFTMSGYQ